MKGLILINLLIAIVCMILAAASKNWEAALGWFVASLWIFRHIVEKELK